LVMAGNAILIEKGSGSRVNSGLHASDANQSRNAHE